MSKCACIFTSQLIVIQVCYISLYTDHLVLFALTGGGPTLAYSWCGEAGRLPEVPRGQSHHRLQGPVQGPHCQRPGQEKFSQRDLPAVQRSR